MIDAVNVPVQTVEGNANVLFSATRIRTGCTVRHETGSGRFLALKPGIYRVSFGANVAIPTGGTVGPINMALTIDGEDVAGSEMISTPTAVDTYNNISTDALIRVYPSGGAASIGIRNAGAEAVSVQDANVVITREC